MGLEYRTDYCKTCKADRKLERKVPNHILHLLITVVLGVFTYGIGSAIWIAVWFLISTKFSGWSCHVCGSKNIEPVHHHSSHSTKHSDQKTHNNKTGEEFKNNESLNVMDTLKKYSKIIIILLVSVPVFVFVFSLTDNGNGDNNTKNKQKKENVVNATIDVEEKKLMKKKSTVNDNEIESGLCYLYDIQNDSNSIKGFVSCKEGKLIVRLYDSESKTIIETKTVPFKDNKFYIKIDDLDKKDFQFAIQLTKEQKAVRQKQIKEKKDDDIPSIQSYNNESNNNEKNHDTNKCSIQSWKYSKYSDEYLVVDGKTTCTKGKIILRVFDENNNNLGAESDSIESGVFSVFFKTTSNPTSITLKYTITQK